MNSNIKIGILLGVLLSVLDFIRYLINPISIFGNFQNLIITILISFGFLFWAVKKFKQENNGFATYGEALKVTFIVLVLSIAITETYDIFFYNVIAPDFFQKYKTEIITISKEQLAKPLRFMGASEVNIQEQMEKFDAQADKRILEMQQDTNTFKGIITEFGSNLLACLVFCLIVSIFLKKAPKKEIAQSS